MDSMKGFLNLPTWIRWTFLGLFVIGMFSLIWWMDKEETEREATLMTVCWDAEGVAHYQDEGNYMCPSGVELLQWTKKTKEVYWSFAPDFNVYGESHRNAVKWVNDELGFEALLLSESPLADIVIVHGSVNEGSGSMHTSHTKTNGKIRATITVRTPSNIRAWMIEEEHELLHALGLAHDRSGIMSPKAGQEPNGMRVRLLHDKDRKALRDLLLTPLSALAPTR